ncbi:hypothetical protein [Flaviaesturariibacter amylovorans]|uniref:Uncharacterized protein n=1 Tax=Flaviaesturariibacter amylovorans TaxID=1084520 RepID=A0ABP8GPT4_9BACT
MINDNNKSVLYLKAEIDAILGDIPDTYVACIDAAYIDEETTRLRFEFPAYFYYIETPHALGLMEYYWKRGVRRFYEHGYSQDAIVVYAVARAKMQERDKDLAKNNGCVEWPWALLSFFTL